MRAAEAVDGVGGDLRPWRRIAGDHDRQDAGRGFETARNKIVALTDRITLTGLRVRGYHGVHAFERKEGQDFVVDVELDVDLGSAARSDDLTDTVGYGDLARSLAAIVGGEPVNLLETLAQRLAEACLAYPPVTGCSVTVHKPQAPIGLAFDDVAVTIRRHRE